MAFDWASLGDKAKEAADSLGSKAKEMGLFDPGKKVESMIEGLQDLPLGPDMTSEDVSETVEKPEESKFDETFRKLTGIDTGGFSASKLGNHLSGKLAALKDLLIGTLMSCIRKWLMKMMHKFPLLGLLLNLDRAFGEFVGKYKRIVEDWIDKTVKDIIYRKIGIQQLAEMNKKLTEMIRSICEERSAKDLRDQTNNFTLAEYAAETGVDALNAAIKETALDQSDGYAAKDPDMYVNADGTVKTTSQRLNEAKDTLNKLTDSVTGGDEIAVRLENMTVEEAVSVKSLVREINQLKQIDQDEKSLSTITC